MKPTPQRKPNKTMTGEQILLKAVTGTHKTKTPNERLEEQANKILNGKQPTKS